jgi:predicted DNA-binding protein (UPF0251 family)
MLLTDNTSSAIFIRMTEFTLSQYVDTHGQTETASRLGITQGAVWQMLKSGRSILVTESKDGTVEAWERKTVGKRQQN